MKYLNTKILLGALFSLLIFLSSSTSSFATTYYVDATTGLDSDTGLTEDLAWQNLSKVSGFAFNPGDSILFKKGETWSGALTVSSSGTSGNLITYSTYGTGADPIIDRTGGSYAIAMSSKSYVRIEGLKVQNATSGQFLLNGDVYNVELDSITTSGGNRGIFLLGDLSDITVSNSTLTNHTADGISNGTGTQTNLTFNSVLFVDTVRGMSLTGSPNTVTINSSTFSGLSSYGLEIALNKTVTNLIISDSHFDSNLAGIYSRGTISGMTIDDSFFNTNSGSGISLAAGSGVTMGDISFNNTELNDNGSHGITFGGSGGSFSNISVSNSTISNNTYGFHVINTIDNVDISGSTVNGNSSEGVLFITDTGTAATDIDIVDTVANNNGGNGFSFWGLGLSNDAVLTRVTASNNDNDGINVKQGWTNVNVYNCTAETNGTDGIGGDGDGISYHGSTTGIIKYCYVSNNLKSAIAHVDDSDVDMSYNLFRHDTNGTISLVHVDGTGTYSLFNNILYSGAQTGNGLYMTAGANVTVKNNIIYGFDNGMVNSGATVNADYNLAYNTGTTGWSGITQGVHSLITNPSFINASTGDFRLNSNSPAINSGSSVGETLDYVATSVPQGSGVDIGAYEFIIPSASSGPVQYNSDGTISINIGGATTGSSVKLKFSMSSLNALDLLTPQLEVRAVGTSFTNSPTHSGAAVNYLGSNIWGEVTVSDLIPGTSYHWQARIINPAGEGTWTSFGGNLESASDFSRSAVVVPVYYLAVTPEVEDAEDSSETTVASSNEEEEAQDTTAKKEVKEEESVPKEENNGFPWLWAYILGGMSFIATIVFYVKQRAS